MPSRPGVETVRWALRPTPPEKPRHLLGIGDVDDILASVASGIDTFDCATPTRVARHGTALVADPAARWRLDLAKGRFAESDDPIAPDCPCPACRDHTRGYIHYLVREKELTGARLVTLHNLTFMALLMEGIRGAIVAGDLDGYARRVMRGEAPYSS